MMPRRQINFKVMGNNGKVFVRVNGHLDGTTAYEVRSTLHHTAFDLTQLKTAIQRAMEANGSYSGLQARSLAWTMQRG